MDRAPGCGEPEARPSAVGVLGAARTVALWRRCMAVGVLLPLPESASAASAAARRRAAMREDLFIGEACNMCACVRVFVSSF